MWSEIELELQIRRTILDCLQLEGVRPEAIPLNERNFLQALGASSIDAMNILVSVEEQFDLRFDENQFGPELLLTLGGFLTEVRTILKRDKRHSDTLQIPENVR